MADWPTEGAPMAIQSILGTGLFVSFEGHFTTAAHVLKDRFKWSKKTGNLKVIAF
jgi:hypothetical protein